MTRYPSVAARLFDTLRPPETQEPMSVDLVQQHPALFPNLRTAERFCGNFFYPRSENWIYQLNAKSGNTSTFALLFELEFGVPFHVHLKTETNQHPDFALFQIGQAGLYATVRGRGLTLAEFDSFPGLRLATVRNPFTRAVSSFLYLCRSQKIGDRRFLSERIRISALGGFDWSRHDGTAKGFLKFLAYTRATQLQCTPDMIDAHWLPQVQHIQPTIYRPDLIGRVEELDKFAVEIAERLGKRPPKKKPHRNQSKKGDEKRIDFYADKAAVRMVREIYADDFTAFDYSDVPPGKR